MSILFNQDPIQIISTTYFRQNDLKLWIKLLFENTKVPFTLSIIDNSSTKLDSLFDELSFDYKFSLYKNNTNIGKARSFMKFYNQIVHKQTTKLFISMDPDIIVQKDWLFKLLIASHRLNDFGFVAPVIVNNDTDSFDKQLHNNKLIMHKLSNNKFLYDNIMYTDHIAGPLLLINRKFFDRVGGFDCAQLYGGEDGDLCKKARRLKIPIGIVTDCVVRHADTDGNNNYKLWKRQHVNDNTTTVGYWD